KHRIEKIRKITFRKAPTVGLLTITSPRSILILVLPRVIAGFFKFFGMFPVLAVFIVFLLLFGIAQNGMSFIDLLKLCLCLFVIGIQVRMIFPCQFSIGFFYIRYRSGFVQTEKFIIIDELHDDTLI